QSLDTEKPYRVCHQTIRDLGIRPYLHLHHHGRESGVLYHLEHRHHAGYGTNRCLGGHGRKFFELFGLSQDHRHVAISIRDRHSHVRGHFWRLGSRGIRRIQFQCRFCGGPTTGFYSPPCSLLLYKIDLFRNDHSYHLFLSWLLYAGRGIGGRKSEYHFLCMDQCGHYNSQLRANTIITGLMIEVDNLHKSFGDSHVLKGISTTFDKGKTNLIIGQSGSGKTVFLKSLLGLFTPDDGNICYDGKNYSDLSLSEQRDLRQEMGMVFQGSALFDSMTVEGNVMFPLGMFTKQSKSEMQDRVDFVLKRVNLVDAHKKFPSEISGGMQKRVAIARAIVMN